MIEELKLILDAIGDLSGVAIWVVGAFILYKVILYLSTTGAVVYIAKLLIIKMHSAISASIETRKTPKTIEYDFDGILLGEETKKEVHRTLMVVREHKNLQRNTSTTLRYFHSSEADWLHQAVKEKIEREAA